MMMIDGAVQFATVLELIGHMTVIVHERDNVANGLNDMLGSLGVVQCIRKADIHCHRLFRRDGRFAVVGHDS